MSIDMVSAYLKAILRLLQRAPTAAEHRCRSREAHLWSCSISCDSIINCDRAKAISDAAVQTSSPFSPRIPIHRVARKEAATFMSLHTALYRAAASLGSAAFLDLARSKTHNSHLAMGSIGETSFGRLDILPSRHIL